MFNRIIFALNGPSAGGKTTILENITEGFYTKGQRFPLINGVGKLITVTTRLPRPSEINGVHYNFMTPEQFLEQENAGNIVEKTVYAGVTYGILDSEIKRIMQAGMDVMVALDQHGINEMKKFYGAENVVSIFVYRDLKDILFELKKRPISEEEVNRRFEQAKGELKNLAYCDHVVYNIESLEKAVKEVSCIIQVERLKRNLG